MNSENIIGKLNLKFWWVIFGLFQSLLVILMILTMSITDWVSGNYSNEFTIFYLDENQKIIENYFSGSKFHGSLNKCTNGCDQTSYSVLSTAWCNQNTKNQANPFYSSTVQSICSLFSSLSGSSFVFMLFELSSILQIIAWLISMLALTRFLRCYFAVCCCSISSCISHYLAVTVWFTITQASFINCSYFPNDGSTPSVCAHTGPVIGLSVCLIFPIGLFLFLLVSTKYYNQQKAKNLVSVEDTQRFSYRDNIQPIVIVANGDLAQSGEFLGRGSVTEEITNSNFTQNWCCNGGIVSGPALYRRYDEEGDFEQRERGVNELVEEDVN